MDGADGAEINEVTVVVGEDEEANDVEEDEGGTDDENGADTSGDVSEKKGKYKTKEYHPLYSFIVFPLKKGTA